MYGPVLDKDVTDLIEKVSCLVQELYKYTVNMYVYKFLTEVPI